MALALLCPPAAVAGPPYDTDDPVPTDLHHWEIYGFAAGSRAGHAFDGQGGLDLNYGAAPGLQLTATVPFDFTRGGAAATHVGDLELGAKYRFWHAGGWSAAVFPRAILPTSGHYGSGRVGMLLPLWLEHDAARWSLFGGGGYALNPGAGNRSYALVAVALTRAVSERLSIGAEATRHGRDAADARATTTLGLGATYRLHGPFALLAAAGPSFAGRGGERYHGYAALELLF